jgi:hypothetical protein
MALLAETDSNNMVELEQYRVGRNTEIGARAPAVVGASQCGNKVARLGLDSGVV